MKGLILKDMYVIWKNLKISLLAMVIFLAAAVADSESASIYCSMAVIFSVTIPINLISFDESWKWDAYADTLPCTRAQAVSVKYIIGLVSIMVMTLLASVLQIVLGGGEAEPGETVGLASVYVFMGLLMPSLMLPLIYKFTATKGRVIMVIFICFGYAFIFGLRRTNLFDGLHSVSLNSLPYWLLLAAFALYGLSWLLSIKIYKNRDF